MIPTSAIQYLCDRFQAETQADKDALRIVRIWLEDQPTRDRQGYRALAEAAAAIAREEAMLAYVPARPLQHTWPMRYGSVTSR